MNEIRTDANWVEAQLGCSLQNAFLSLKSRIENDVREWMNRTARHATVSDGHWGVIVSLQVTQFGDTAWCRIEVAEKLLVAVVERKREQKEFNFSPRLNSKGECVLVVDGSGVAILAGLEAAS